MSSEYAGERPGRERRSDAALALLAIAVTAATLLMVLFLLLQLLSDRSDTAATHDFESDRFVADAVVWLAAEGTLEGSDVRCFNADGVVDNLELRGWLPDATIDPTDEFETRTTALDAIWRVAGAPEASALAWALDVGIAAESKTFVGRDFITRGELVTWLWRAAGSPRHDPAIDTACRSDGSAPPPTGFPTSATTGIAGAGLLVSDLTASESITVVDDGAVIEMFDVAGSIRVQADNVTIRRTRIRHEAAFGIVAEGKNLVIEDVTIIGVGDQTTAAVGLFGFTCRRCDLSGSTDGAAAYADVVIEDSFIHDLRRTDTSHNDGIQGSGGSNVTIRHNSIIGPFQTSTSAILAQTNIAPIDNWHITDNYLSGGSFSVYLRDKDTGNGEPTNSSIARNVFARSSTGVSSSCAESRSIEECNEIGYFVSMSSSVTTTDNRLDDGTPLG